MTDNPILKIEQVSMSYGRFVALRNVSISIFDNTIHAIIGPNGAGKSTLLSVLAGNLTATSGNITLKGRNITGLKIHQRAQLGIARSYQHSNVFEDLSIEENVLVSLVAGSKIRKFFSRDLLSDHCEQACEIIRNVGLLKATTTRAAQLSHGEHRQLEIGMAIARSPKLLLLDEPLAGLSIAEIFNVTELISTLRKNCAIILVEHDMGSVFTLSDRVTVMIGGEVFREGDPESIKADQEVKRYYLGE